MMEVLKRAKLRRQRIQFTVLPYETFLFSPITDASLLKNVVAALPIPLVDDITKGVNVVCSTSLTHCSYCLFFFCSCLLYVDARGPCRFDWALGLNILTSKNAFSNLPPQKPYIATSRRAPSQSDVTWSYLRVAAVEVLL